MAFEARVKAVKMRSEEKYGKMDMVVGLQVWKMTMGNVYSRDVSVPERVVLWGKVSEGVQRILHMEVGDEEGVLKVVGGGG